MKRWLKFTLAGMGVTMAALVIPSAYSVATTRPIDAVYPIPNIVCGCGHREYLAFKHDRGLWWNAGHNKKDEYYYTESSASNKLELYDWQRKHVGKVQFRWLWIDLQMDGYPELRIFRQLNWIRLRAEKRDGLKEVYRYETLEQKTAKIAEYQKKKEAEKTKNEPNQ
jgi:hypothetical protein